MSTPAFLNYIDGAWVPSAAGRTFENTGHAIAPEEIFGPVDASGRLQRARIDVEKP